MSGIDPTLRLDLLAKVQSVQLSGGERNLFQFSTPPASPTKDIKIPVKKPSPTDSAVASTQPEKAAAPKAPPINLKYYGFSSQRRDGPKRAFFLDGEEILVASEGDIIKRKYKVVRIGVNSVVMEDTDLKSQQTLPLQEEG